MLVSDSLASTAAMHGAANSQGQQSRPTAVPFKMTMLFAVASAEIKIHVVCR